MASAGNTPAAAAGDLDLLSEQGLRRRIQEKTQEQGPKLQQDVATGGQEYRILHAATVRDTSKAGVGAIIAELEPGEVVNVVERMSFDQAIRARIDRPTDGWISLKTCLGHNLAEKTTVDDAQPQCWVCFGDDDLEILILPCACKGSQATVHSNCLLHWLEVKSQQNQQSQGSPLKCDICKEAYHVSRSQLTWTDSLKMVGHVVSMITTITVVLLQMYFTFFNLVWVNGSLGDTWYYALLAVYFYLHNVGTIVGQILQGVRAIQKLNNNRIQSVQCRFAPEAGPEGSDCPSDVPGGAS